MSSGDPPEFDSGFVLRDALVDPISDSVLGIRGSLFSFPFWVFAAMSRPCILISGFGLAGLAVIFLDLVSALGLHLSSLFFLSRLDFRGVVLQELVFLGFRCSRCCPDIAFWNLTCINV